MTARVEVLSLPAGAGVEWHVGASRAVFVDVSFVPGCFQGQLCWFLRLPCLYRLQFGQGWGPRLHKPGLVLPRCGSWGALVPPRSAASWIRRLCRFLA